MKLLIVFTSLIILGVTALIYITDINQFSEAKSFIANRAMEAVVLGSKESTQITENDDSILAIKKRFSTALHDARDSKLKYPDYEVTSEGERVTILVITDDFLRLPILKLDRIKISLPVT